MRKSEGNAQSEERVIKNSVISDEIQRANKNIKEAQKNRALHLLWAMGWMDEEIAMALSVSKKRIREWHVQRLEAREQ